MKGKYKIKMAQKSKSKLRTAVYQNFKGIDSGACYKRTDSFRSMENFRVLSDGSLKKRDGYRTVLTQSLNIRAIWGGYTGEQFACYVLIESKLYKLDLESAELTLCGSTATSTSHAEFFFLRDTLYLKDLRNFYRVSDGALTPLGGYVPLLGKDWGSGYAGEINEPLNLMHRHARITYRMGDDVSAYLPTLYEVASVEALYKNGALLSSDEYTVDARYNTINVSGLVSGDTLEAHLTFTDGDAEEKEKLLSFCHCGVFGGIRTNRLFLWGENSAQIFNSRYVSREDELLSENAYADSGTLYFVKDDAFIVGEGRYPVRAVRRHYDRLLIFTSGDAWMANESVSGNEEFPTLKINANTGVSSRFGTASAGNDPVTVGRHAIYRWTSETEELNDCNAYRISDPVAELLGDEFFDRAIAHSSAKHGEIWFSDPEGDGSVWVYDHVKKYWTCFTDIYAERFFDADGEVGFISEGRICVFSDELSNDYKSPNLSVRTIIYGRLKSGYHDFGDADIKKLYYLVCRADFDSSTLYISVTSDKSRKTSVELGPKSSYALVKRRLTAQRMTGFYFDLTAGGDGRQRIYSIELEAR